MCYGSSLPRVKMPVPRKPDHILMQEKAANLIYEHQNSLAQAAVERHFARQSPLHATSKEKCLEDVGYHLKHLAEAIRFDAPELFLDYVAWAKVLFFSLGSKTSELQEDLSSISEAIQKIIPSIHNLVRGHIETAIRKLPEMPTDPESFINPNAPHGTLARDWMDALMARDRRRACALIFEAIESGVQLTEIYDHVLVSCLRETGRLWQTQVINEAQEHFCAETANTLLSILTAQSEFDVPKKRKLAVGFCVANEQHSLGLRMALDSFELLGWDTVPLGANLPLRNIDWLFQKWKPDVIAISVTMIYHLSDAQKAIAAMHAAAPTHNKPKIIIGGRPFNLCPGLWKKVGADMEAGSCQRAMEIAQSLEVEHEQEEFVRRTERETEVVIG